jgi:hypothetical protein
MLILAPGETRSAVEAWVDQNAAMYSVDIVSELDPDRLPDVIVGVENYFPTDPNALQADGSPRYAVFAPSAVDEERQALAGEIAERLQADVATQLGALELSYAFPPENFQHFPFLTDQTGGNIPLGICCVIIGGIVYCQPKCAEAPPALRVSGEEAQSRAVELLNGGNSRVPVIVATDDDVVEAEREITIPDSEIENLSSNLEELIEADGDN